MIRTSKKNKEIVGKLTRKFGFGFENHISRIAFAYSIKSDEKLDLAMLQNSSGKAYSESVFFGDNLNLYLGLVCVKYALHSTDKDILKYVKLHIDHGLESIDKIVNEKGIQNGFELINNLSSD